MNKHYLKTLASSLLLAGLSPALFAANAITAIDLVNNSQNEPVLAISFAEAPTTPASWPWSMLTRTSPARPRYRVN